MKDSERTRQESVEQTDVKERLATELQECPVCGAVGLPERIEDHDCQAFLEYQEEK